MKKLSNISESVWGNISKRADGSLERKEDDINLMDGENFANYLNKRYSFKDEHKIEYNETLNIMTIPGLCAGDEFCDDNVGVDYVKDSLRIIYMWINDSALSEQVRSVLKKRFKLLVRGSYTFLSPLDGEKLTNKFVVNVLDYMADLDMDDINIRRAVCESVWGNISKRAEGTLDRKEDDFVNELDAWEFYEYLKNTYSRRPSDFDDENGDFIVYNVVKGVTCSLNEITDNIYVSLNEEIQFTNADLYKKLCNKYEVIFMDYSKSIWSDDSYFDVAPKDGSKVDFKFYLDVLDFVIDNVNGKYKLHRK